MGNFNAFALGDIPVRFQVQVQYCIFVSKYYENDNYHSICKK